MLIGASETSLDHATDPLGVEGARVLLVVSGLMFGGGQRVAQDLWEVGRRQGRDLVLLLLGRKKGVVVGQGGLSIEYDGRYNRIGTLLSTAFRLRRVLDEQRPAVLHTHGWDADVIGNLACQGRDTKQVIHLHVTPDWLNSPAQKHRARRWLTRRALTRTGSRIVAVSDAVKDHWTSSLGLDPTGTQVVRNGVDVVRFQPSEVVSESCPPTVGIAARLVPMKGIEYLLDALGSLCREGIAFRLKVAGTGALRSALEDRCARIGIQERTDFLGHVEDMPAFYRSIDIYALPSVSTEGLPLGVLEAMASGIPVVATTVAGTLEAVRNGVDGLLVPPRDVRSLHDALRTLLASSVARSTMGKAGRIRAEEDFSFERFSSEIFDLYRSIVSE